jgi:hypothetical protein
VPVKVVLLALLLAGFGYALWPWRGLVMAPERVVAQAQPTPVAAVAAAAPTPAPAARTLLVAVDMVTGSVRGLANVSTEEGCLAGAEHNQPLGSWARGYYHVKTGERLDCRAPK